MNNFQDQADKLQKSKENKILKDFPTLRMAIGRLRFQGCMFLFAVIVLFFKIPIEIGRKEFLDVVNSLVLLLFLIAYIFYSFKTIILHKKRSWNSLDKAIKKVTYIGYCFLCISFVFFAAFCLISVEKGGMSAGVIIGRIIFFPFYYLFFIRPFEKGRIDIPKVAAEFRKISAAEAQES